MGNKFPVDRHKPDLSNLHVVERKLSLTDVYAWMFKSILESYEYAVIIEDDLQLVADFSRIYAMGKEING